MINWGSITKSVREKDCVRFDFAEGKLEVRGYGPSTMRLTWISANAKVRPSRAVIARQDDAVSLSGETGAVAGNLKLAISKESGEIEITGTAGTILRSAGGLFVANRPGDAPAGNRGLALRVALGADESIYGLGEKTGALNKRGRRYQMWNTDEPLHTPDRDPLYQSIPFMIRFDGAKSSGLFLDSTGRSFFDVGFTDENELEIEAIGDVFDLYVFDGGSEGPATVGKLYSSLTGTMKIPPLWSLGFQQCRWSYFPESRVMEIAEGFRERDIPCDVIYLDIDYMDGYRVFTWDRERFPDPAKMSAKLRSMGFKLVTIIDPGVKRDAGYRVYAEGCKQGVFCALPTGEVYHGRVWPGESAYPDFSSKKTRSWWADLHGALFDAGVDGVWNDMNEPSDFRSDVPADDRTKMTVPDIVMMGEDGDPRPFAEGHNCYAFDMCRATVDAFAKLKPGIRPFILTRAGYAGIQRYSAVWTGDNHSWWEHLASAIPMLLNLSLSGVPFCGGDAGGFQGNSSGELYARWMQFAALTPFFRAHSAINTKPHEPWAFGPEVEKIARDAIRLRYSLMPYLYGEMRRAALDGQPVIRSMVGEFPGDPAVRDMADQFMFGPSILVAPILQEGKRERLVYLPAGVWYDFRTNERIDGGRTIVAAAPLDVIPLFVRAGAIIPTVEPAAHTGALDFSRLIVRAYAGAEGRFELYEDDGLTTDYESGSYNLSRISLASGSRPAISVERLHRGWNGGCEKPGTVYIGFDPF